MGGRVFESCKPIRREHIMPTLIVFADEMSKLFPDKTDSFYNLVGIGSVGKKDISGDIDLAYDVKNLYAEDMAIDFNGWNVLEDEHFELFHKFLKRARTATHEQCMLRAMIELIGNYIEDNSDIIFVDTKSSGSNILFLSTLQRSGYKKSDELGTKVLDF